MSTSRKAEASRFRLRDLLIFGGGLFIASSFQAAWLAFLIAGCLTLCALLGIVLIWAEWVLDKHSKKE